MELRAKNARGKLFLFALGSVAFVTAGVYALAGQTLYSMYWWAGVVCLGLFGPCSLVFLLRALDARDALVINARGVFDRRVADRVIPWSAIRSASIRSIRGNPYLLLALSRPVGDFVDHVLKRMVLGVNAAFGFGDIYIHLSMLDVSGEEIEEVFRHYKKL
jgi:hypothetical protein